jgi:ABC-type nitrate/sulfonate/bicarbonate transport system substrate-binding protein
MRRFAIITTLALLLAACGGSAAVPSASPSSQPPTSAAAKPAPSASTATKPAASADASAKPAAGASAPASGAAKPLSQTKLRFALPINSGLQVLPEVALEAGYFKDEGLDASITMIRGSQEVIAAMTKGEIDLANSDSPSIIQAHLSGANT